MFGFAVLAGSDTLDVAGVTDLAGNPLFPAFDQAVDAEDPAPVDFAAGATIVATLVGEENEGAAKVLRAAAWTYVAAAVSSLLTLLYFLIRSGLLGGRRN